MSVYKTNAVTAEAAETVFRSMPDGIFIFIFYS